ncbi:Neutral alpha-glucosidase AB [Fusarium oxysporum f. sp. conglutinans]|nr:Neutral alpha-glucosidase AB [Fusarium oxysporum f. sp. conglutinans]
MISSKTTAGQAHHTGLTASTPPLSTDCWNGLFDYTVFKGTMVNTFIWKDMNEPSVFNGPEIIMPKGNLRFGGWEHRDLHNLNGMMFHNATYHVMMTRREGELRRPLYLPAPFFQARSVTARHCLVAIKLLGVILLCRFL